MAQMKGHSTNKTTVLYDPDSLTAEFLGTFFKRCLYKIAVLLLKWDLSFFLQHMPQIPFKADDDLVRNKNLPSSSWHACPVTCHCPQVSILA